MGERRGVALTTGHRGMDYMDIIRFIFVDYCVAWMALELDSMVRNDTGR